MNFIINGFLLKSTQPIIYRILEEFKVKNCHLTGYSLLSGKIKVPPFTKVILYYHKILYFKGPQLSNIMNTKPVDAKILRDLGECEMISLKNMERLSQILPEYENYNYRKMIYLKNVRYWNHKLEADKIDLVIFSVIPHMIYDVILYYLCKIKNIPFISLAQTHIRDTTLFFDNFEDPHIQLRIIYNQLREDLKNVPESEIQLANRFESHLKKQYSDPTPFYVQKNKKSSKKNIFLSGSFPIFIKFLKYTNLKELKNNFFQMRDLIKKFLFHLKYLKWKKIWLRRYKKLFTYYETLTTEPDLSKNYIYVPLHYQPEATTSPIAGIFVDQQLLIHLISYLLPEDIYLYVKEHPAQTAFCRDTEFYDEILSNSNVRLISRSFDTYKLIENSIAIATCSGRAGWEALFKNRPVLVFGAIYYQYVKGAFRINTIEECQYALDQIINQKIKPTLKDIKVFMKALELSGIEGRNFPFFDNYYITEEQNIDNMSKAIIEKIRSLLI